MVDDEPSQREVLRLMLEALGYAVTTASSGEEALELMGSERFALLVLDMAMPPGLNGHQTYAAALQIEPRQKAIVSCGLLEPLMMSALQPRLVSPPFYANPTSWLI